VRMVQAYEHWLGDAPERDILRMMGLFDRPVEKGAVDILKAAPAMEGVTEQLRELSEEDWQYALANLRAANLLAEADPEKPGALDCHPLIREYFGQRLSEKNPGGWKAAHTRLYHYYKSLPEKDLPATLEEMDPLFAAIAHGCRAGLHQEAMDEVYEDRIRRKSEAFIVHKLGAFGADLAALSHFFEVPWSRPAAGLTDITEAAVLGWAGFRLRAVGRLREAGEPMKAGLEMAVKLKRWGNAAIAAGNLSELMLTLGQVSEAVDFARQSVTHADRSGDDFQREGKRGTLADALHQSGRLEEAEALFREAEAMQKKSQPEYHYLYSLRGFQFCDLLLGQGKYREVMERVEKLFEWRLPSDPLLDISLDNLIAGRAWLNQAREKGAETETKNAGADWDRAKAFLDQAVTGLREAGYQHMLVLGLFSRAAYYRHRGVRGDFSNGWSDLIEAREIAELGSMGLHLCDYHLEAGRLKRAEGNDPEAAHHFETAKEMIQNMGYHRRDNEIVTLVDQLELF
ncbi:MAG: tetratricopeptide repeat protein, partial [bacterium]|nr:tetratricopeptide repeat protein [bacterium]